MNKNKFFIISILIIIFDQITKLYFTNKDINISNFLSFSYTENAGAAFSLFQNQRFALISISVLVFLILFYYFRKIDNKLALTGVSFLFGGIIGNLIDRVYFGYVRDFIDFKIWPVFNIADTLNTIGVVLLAYYMIKNE